jgi:Ni/Co efflux regulator RcnB
MRKFIISALMAATVLPASGAMAQSYGEARRSQQEVRRDRQDLRQAQRYGDRRDVRDARQDLRDSRREAREDWRDYRQSHRGVYTLPRYYAPRGHVYRPATVGIRIAPAFYGRSYWISDPYRYRLPPVVGAQRWVRYGNDVLLIDTRTGRVLRANNGFFY